MKCTFCGNKIEEGTGMLVVKADGTILSFCRSKCEKNSRIRNLRHVRWTETYRNQNKKNKS